MKRECVECGTPLKNRDSKLEGIEKYLCPLCRQKKILETETVDKRCNRRKKDLVKQSAKMFYRVKRNGKVVWVRRKIRD